ADAHPLKKYLHNRYGPFYFDHHAVSCVLNPPSQPQLGCQSIDERTESHTLYRSFHLDPHALTKNLAHSFTTNSWMTTSGSIDPTTNSPPQTEQASRDCVTEIPRRHCGHQASHKTEMISNVTPSALVPRAANINAVCNAD